MFLDQKETEEEIDKNEVEVGVNCKWRHTRLVGWAVSEASFRSGVGQVIGQLVGRRRPVPRLMCAESDVIIVRRDAILRSMGCGHIALLNLFRL